MFNWPMIRKVGESKKKIESLRYHHSARISLGKEEKIKEDSLDAIPSPSVKIQIIGGKVIFCLYT